MIVYKIHLLVFFILCLASVLLYLVIPPVSRGFFCDDETIKNPIVSATVPNAVVVIVSFVAAFLIIATREYNKPMFRATGIIYEIIPFTFGWIGTLFLTLFTKNRVGRLRPYFITFCNPDMSKCIDPMTNQTLKGVYLEDVICQNTNKSKIQIVESRTSFFSGHASTLAFSSLYLALFIHENMQNYSIILRSLVQFLLILFSLFVGYSRIVDYQHFLSDVYVGLSVGYAIAIFTYLFVSPYYSVYGECGKSNSRTPLFDISSSLGSSPVASQSLSPQTNDNKQSCPTKIL